MKFYNSVLALSVLSVATTAQMANAQARSAAPVANETTEDISLDWPSADAKVVQGVHIKSATIVMKSGQEWSWGQSSPGASSSSKKGYDAYATRGPGTMSISFEGSAGGACPVTYDAVKPIAGIGIVVKKNPGGSSERFALSDVSVSRCDASGMTISYSSIATYDIKKNEKI